MYKFLCDICFKSIVKGTILLASVSHQNLSTSDRLSLFYAQSIPSGPTLQELYPSGSGMEFSIMHFYSAPGYCWCNWSMILALRNPEIGNKWGVLIMRPGSCFFWFCHPLVAWLWIIVLLTLSCNISKWRRIK